MDKAEELKKEFLQNYTPGNYTDQEFNEIVKDFEKDLDEYADEVSREVAVEFFWDKTPSSKLGLYNRLDVYEMFDEWKSKQVEP